MSLLHYTIQFDQKMKKHLLLILPFAFLVTNYSCKPNEPAPTVLGISLDRATLSLAEGDSTLLLVNFVPKGSSENTTWTSSNEEVATVKNGKIKAISRGAATIIATTETTKVQTSCDITVTRTDLPYQLIWSDEFNGTIRSILQNGVTKPEVVDGEIRKNRTIPIELIICDLKMEAW